jgi:nucleoside-diphosphate-sugar epimerase
MRFDLVVNGMTLALWKFNKIKIMRPGTQMRPVVHIRDTVKALILAIECEQEIINGQIFNVGSNDQNYSIYELARRIGNSSGRSYTLEWYGEPDKRTYSVDFQKINKILKFKADYYPENAVREIIKALDYNIIEDAPYTRVIEWWEHMCLSGQV